MARNLAGSGTAQIDLGTTIVVLTKVLSFNLPAMGPGTICMQFIYYVVSIYYL